MNTIIIGCKLPHGIVLHGTAGQAIKLNGMNTSLIEGGFGLTHVDADEAAFLFAQYADFDPIKSQAIFSHGTNVVADVADMAADLAEVKTGFEGMDPDKPAPGLQPEDDGKLDKQKAEAQAKPRPARAPKSAADKAAAKELAGKA